MYTVNTTNLRKIQLSVNEALECSDVELTNVLIERRTVTFKFGSTYQVRLLKTSIDNHVERCINEVLNTAYEVMTRRTA